MNNKYKKPEIQFYEFELKNNVMLTVVSDNLDDQGNPEDVYDWNDIFGNN